MMNAICASRTSQFSLGVVPSAREGWHLERGRSRAQCPACGRLAALPHHCRRHGSAPAREAEAQRGAPLVHRKALRQTSRPRPLLRRLAPHLVCASKSHPPPPPYPPSLVSACRRRDLARPFSLTSAFPTPYLPSKLTRTRNLLLTFRYSLL